LAQTGPRLCQVRHDGNVTLPVAREALAALEVDDAGLDDRDRSLLRAITDKFGGGPVGLETLAAAVSEDSETIEDVYEPYLLQEGYLKRTPRGRVATERSIGTLASTCRRTGRCGMDRCEALRAGARDQRKRARPSLPTDRRSSEPAAYGVEALVRWRHPERGLVSPLEFIAKRRRPVSFAD